MYPIDDKNFEEVKIDTVNPQADGQGWAIGRDDGWSFFVPESPVEPKPGMLARFYGKGIGYPVRGLFLDGTKVFYRTETEDKEEQELQMYGADAAEWLRRWDDGQNVWSIEMGGIGPGYEQAIQITVAEILRRMLSQQYDVSKWSDHNEWTKVREEIYEWGMDNSTVKSLGLSGAQWDAAVSLASSLYRQGPRTLFTDIKLKDRKIQVSRTFPVAA